MSIGIEKSDSYCELVLKSSDGNMEKLRFEVEKFEALGFKEGITSGYGAGVFSISVKMVHPRFGEVYLSLPQCADDGSDGRVSLTSFNEFGFLSPSYSF